MSAYVQHLPPAVGATTEKVAVQKPNSGVVDADVDAAESGLDLVEQGKDLRLVRQVALDRMEAPSGVF